MKRTNRSWQQAGGQEQGFSLIESLVAMMILTTGLMSLAGVLAIGLQRASTSAPSLIAREKAREAVESVHTARDTGALSWNTIQNDSTTGGMFKSIFTPLQLPGPDGLVNTSDDIANSVEEMRTPGKNGILGDSDDVKTPLTNFERKILITSLNKDGTSIVNPNLRKIVVTVKFTVDGHTREYVLTTFISNFS